MAEGSEDKFSTIGEEEDDGILAFSSIIEPTEVHTNSGENRSDTISRCEEETPKSV